MQTTITRRAALAGAAALPFAGLAVDVKSQNIYSSAADDPAIDAVRRWLAANLEERGYSPLSGFNWEDDLEAVALSDEERRAWQEMQDTPPTTAAGLSLALAAFLYRMEAYAAGSQFHDPETW